MHESALSNVVDDEKRQVSKHVLTSHFDDLERWSDCADCLPGLLRCRIGAGQVSSERDQNLMLYHRGGQIGKGKRVARLDPARLQQIAEYGLLAT
jgi:hypothetical protein